MLQLEPQPTSVTPSVVESMPASHLNGQEDFWLQLEEHVWSNMDELKITEPYLYINALPGKDMRGRFIDAFNHWLQVPAEPLAIISSIVAMLHTGSLLIDDIEDNSQLRRGQPVAHKIFGIAQAINCGNYVYFIAVQRAMALSAFQREGSDVLSVVISELINLHRGQGLDILWRDSLECPTEAQYIDMVNKKTGGLFRLAVKLMMACATTNADIDYIPLVNLFGVFFQIRDDLMNLDNTEYEKNKGFAEDLTEGKFSFPIIHGIYDQPESKLLINVLQQRPTTPTVKIHAINHLRHRTHSFEYSEAVLDRLETRIEQEIQKLGGNKGLLIILGLLSVRKG
ncbi:Geranylgeranyl pyrophosphate synthase [Hypsizygus marmoreus]|uniref:(2E,6E)-farnesyl diphosphate synthase n=1 Tax=Hypsizygus marmoreus TaxID=39966 RepID=A0A369K8L9_HYPMA|nr:Geranylgeranyl pyrophosphate synthase [Hypsizygus marmoreus]